jgi:hypothetical protein
MAMMFLSAPATLAADDIMISVDAKLLRVEEACAAADDFVIARGHDGGRRLARDDLTGEVGARDGADFSKAALIAKDLAHA